jgi:chromate transporter
VQRRAMLPIAIIVIVFTAIGLLRWPLQPVLLVAIPASLLLVWMARRPA